MGNNTKKVIIVVSISVFVIAIIVGVYFGLQNSKRVIGPGSTGSDNIGNTGGLTGSNTNANTNTNSGLINYDNGESGQDSSSKLKLLTANPVVDFWVNTVTIASSTSYRTFYMNKAGDVVEIIKQGDEKIIASSNVGEPIRIVSNNDGSFVSVLFDDGSWKLFDVNSIAWENIGTNIASVAFSPKGDKLGYIKSVPSGSEIYWYDISVSPYKLTKVISLSVEDMELKWIDSDSLLLVSRPSFYVNGVAWKLNVDKGTLTKFASGKGLIIDFGNNGVGIKTIFDNNGPISSLIDSDGSIIIGIPLHTIPNKCVFSGNKIFCSNILSYDNNQSFVLPDDYFQHSIHSHDSIYGINFVSNNSLRYLSSDNPVFDIQKIFYLESDKKLLFSNNIDNGLYELSITNSLDVDILDNSTSTNK